MPFNKAYTIKNVSKLDKQAAQSALDVHEGVDITCLGPESMQVSDGYHTMDELYEHRIALWIALCGQIALANRAMMPGEEWQEEKPVWRSKLHDDGSNYDGWFILGIGKEKGEMMTYHLPISKWSETDFAETLERAPEWDGHSPADVLERLKNL